MIIYTIMRDELEECIFEDIVKLPDDRIKGFYVYSFSKISEGNFKNDETYYKEDNPKPVLKYAGLGKAGLVDRYVKIYQKYEGFMYVILYADWEY